MVDAHVRRLASPPDGGYSPSTANQDIRHLKALFNFGIKREWITRNPVMGLDFFPTEKRVKYIPPIDDLDKVIATATPEFQDYLLVIRETMARVGEINRLRWVDVDLAGSRVVLYTRKKKGGHLTPRIVPMTTPLKTILQKRFDQRDPAIEWVFFKRYERKRGVEKVVPLTYQKGLMASLCKTAGVEDFRFHALRHAGASLMERNNVPVSSIQRILGHESRTTTEIYLHSIGDAERVAMDVFEATSRKSHTKSHTESHTE